MTDKQIPKSALLVRTIEVLRHRPRTLTYEQISADTGLTTSWLSGLARDVLGSPSVCKIVLLYEYLTKTSLPLL